MGAQTNGNSTFPRQRQIANEREQQEGAQQQDSFQRKYAEQQAMAERMQQQREQRAGNAPTPGSGIAFGPGRSNRGDVDIRRLLQDRMTRGN